MKATPKRARILLTVSCNGRFLYREMAYNETQAATKATTPTATMLKEWMAPTIMATAARNK